MKNQELAEIYRSHLQKFGDTAAACQWGSESSQRQRLEILLAIADRADLINILDFGCGNGVLASLIPPNCSYTGIDIVAEFLALAHAKFPQHRFCTQKDVETDRFDYIFISGTFNINTGNNELFLQKTLRWCGDRATKGIAFNLLSTYADWYDPNLFYKSPESTISLIKSEFGRHCRIQARNDYLLDASVPIEYSVFIKF